MTYHVVLAGRELAHVEEPEHAVALVLALGPGAGILSGDRGHILLVLYDAPPFDGESLARLTREVREREAKILDRDPSVVPLYGPRYLPPPGQE